MNGFLTWQALVMFVLGVVLSATVKGFTGRVTSSVSGG